MLQTMRHLAQSWAFKGLMMILVVSFGIWGVGDIFRGNPMQRTVAKVGSDEISVADLRKQFNGMLIQMRRSFGPDVTNEQAMAAGLLDQALETLISNHQVTEEASRLGIDVTEKEAIQELEHEPEFMNKDGTINRDAFYRLADHENIDEAELGKHFQGMMTQRELFFPLRHNGKLPHTIVDAIAKAEGQKRILDVISISNASVKDVAAVDDVDLRAFYEKNIASFTAPEYRSGTIARLSTDALEKDVTISDDEAKKQYDANPAVYTTPERRDVVQVVVQDEPKAKQLAAAAQASGNLAEAATAMKLTAEPIDHLEQGDLPAQLAKPIFTMNAGQISDPIQTQLGWHVIQLKAVAPAALTPFEKVKKDIIETMKRERAVDTATRALNGLDDELASGKSLEDIADRLHMTLIKLPPVDAHGKDETDKEPTEVAENHKEILDSIFAENTGEVSSVIDDKKGNYMVVRTDEITPSAPRPFDKIKDKIVAAWKAKEQEKRAAQEAVKIAQALRDGKTPASFAGQAGVEVRQSKPISMLGDTDPSLPATLLPQIEKLKKGEVTTAALSDRQLVLRLSKVVEADDATIAAAVPKLGQSVDDDAAKDLISQYQEYLRDEFPARVNEDVVNSMRQQGSTGNGS